MPEIDEARIRENFGRQRHMATLGVTIAHIAPGEVHLAMPYDDRFSQQNGFLHAGAIASLADSANGYAAYTLAPPDTDVLAVEFKINLLEPARAGRTLSICQADVVGADADARLVATMTSTIIIRPLHRGSMVRAR